MIKHHCSGKPLGAPAREQWELLGLTEDRAGGHHTPGLRIWGLYRFSARPHEQTAPPVFCSFSSTVLAAPPSFLPLCGTQHTFKVAREGLKGLDPDIGEKLLLSLLSPPNRDLHSDICCLCGARLGLDYTLRRFSKGRNRAQDTRITFLPVTFTSKGSLSEHSLENEHRFSSAKSCLETKRASSTLAETHGKGTKPLEAPSLGRKLPI